MSAGERRFAWLLVALALFALACGVYLVVTHPNGGDYLWIGLGIIGVNSWNLVRIATCLWEDAHG